MANEKENIKPIYRNYEEWECYQNGMYDTKVDDNRVEMCFEFFNGDEVFEHMKALTDNYPISTSVKFTNKMFNAVSWLGQATCNSCFGANQKEVIKAWLMLDVEVRNKANKNAKDVIEWWKNENI